MQTSIIRSVSAVALTMVLAAGASAAPLDPAVACGFAKMHAALKASSTSARRSARKREAWCEVRYAPAAY